MFELKKYNDALATWVEENASCHWAIGPCQNSKKKKKEDKMTTNLAESFNACL